MKIYHNPRCRKSREVLNLLRDRGLDPVVIEYLKAPLKKKQIEDIISFLNESDYKKIIRKNESIYKEKYKKKNSFKTQFNSSYFR